MTWVEKMELRSVVKCREAFAIFFTDNVLRNGSSAFRFKSNLDRGGMVENIRVRNMDIDTFERLFWFQLNYPE